MKEKRKYYFGYNKPEFIGALCLCILTIAACIFTKVYPMVTDLQPEVITVYEPISYTSGLIEPESLSLEIAEDIEVHTVIRPVYISETEIEEPSEDVIKSFAPRYELSDAEREAVEKTVMCEAGCESFEGQMLVAQCILNAAEYDGISPEKVLSRYQYADYTSLSYEVVATDSVKNAVSSVFDAGDTVTDEPIMFFYNPDLATSQWHESLGYVLTEGHHRFFKLG